MPDLTAPDDDSGWDDLARELGIDELAAKIDAVPVEDEPLAAELAESDEEGVIEAEPGAADDEGEESDVEGAEGTSEDEQPGTGRKRRRRRRRRGRGKGQPGEQATATPGVATDEETAEVEVDGSADEGEEEPADELETAGIHPAAEEDTGSEVLRELIANWNVPAWDDIVGGLYRPDR